MPAIAPSLTALLVDAGLDLTPVLRLVVALTAVLLCLGGQPILAGSLSLIAEPYRDPGARGLSLRVRRATGSDRYLAVGIGLGERGFGAAAALGPIPPLSTLPTLLRLPRR
ncbi:hypothetical protein [Streptomyces sp. ISL-94]|uniref:hypothetical protein n=1 Tax=Streptomyces sp. ISL-94 TaxID=2819190 RepID=UPI001BE54F1E|nr:hypothetical protein [Streptomyces sp. ISL-94]MBT2477184.1 hypothetical protein [Streptomyces sp. ISL-94]